MLIIMTILLNFTKLKGVRSVNEKVYWDIKKLKG